MRRLAPAMLLLVLAACDAKTVTPGDVARGITKARDALEAALSEAEHARELACGLAKADEKHQARCDQAQAYIDAISNALR